MPRIRTIKPEFWGDEKLAPMEPLDRLVFLGLISLADDAGRLLDNVKTIDGFLFPETDDTSRGSLERLAAAGRLQRYRSPSGQKIIQIIGWSKHQKVDHASKYVLPAPGGDDETVAPAPKPPRDPSTGGAREPREALAKDSRSDQGPVPRTSTEDQGPVSPARAGATPPWTAGPRQTWITPFGDAWRAAYDGEMAVEPALKPLRKLVGEHGAEEVLRRWRIYLGSTEGVYASAARFRATWGEWNLAVVDGAKAKGPSAALLRLAQPVCDRYRDAGLFADDRPRRETAVAAAEAFAAAGACASYDAAVDEIKAVRPWELFGLADEAQLRAVAERLGARLSIGTVGRAS